jgi:hypothetical protein
MSTLTKVQELQFELMKLASFNSFDGEKVVADLIKHKDLWQGCILDREDLMKLRDISDNCWTADTLYILTTGKNDKKLQKLAKKWKADAVDCLSGEDASRKLGTSDLQGQVLRVWWD